MVMKYEQGNCLYLFYLFKYNFIVVQLKAGILLSNL